MELGWNVASGIPMYRLPVLVWWVNTGWWVWVSLLSIVLKNSSYAQQPATFFLLSSWSDSSFCSPWPIYVNVPCPFSLFSRCTRFLVWILELKTKKKSNWTKKILKSLVQILILCGGRTSSVLLWRWPQV